MSSIQFACYQMINVNTTAILLYTIIQTDMYAKFLKSYYV